ncbi:MAG: glycoside hydrolase family 3 C-terminal domain-containing protein [Lachnospiraceae bacterium]|nr:glycoside hydrolase family 3 C-terminal domain-containing protein [Lachnospiraceae bacterium]
MAQLFDVNRYAALARQAAAEGIVLLKNDRDALPLAESAKVAVFGRSQFHYYKSGTGSGGLVNAPYVVGILDALLSSEDIQVNASVLAVYQEWLKRHPFDNGIGWAGEPWNQEEMPLTEELVSAAASESETAIVIIGRTAGEDKDNSADKGSYLLTDEEERMLSLVCTHFTKTVVLLNTGNVIDMGWVSRYDPAAVLYVWQGGQEGGNAVLDVLMGRVNPCGKLTDTICQDIADCPASDFGREDQSVYTEDIYVGYRYFETFAPQKVVYPFGFGLSYTQFEISVPGLVCADNTSPYPGEKEIRVTVSVKNVGSLAGKEVVQLYCAAPCGQLGKAARVLCGFAKTRELAPGEEELLTISCPEYLLASYDDSGKSGERFCYVLEAGTYQFFIGTDVRSTSLAGSLTIEQTKVVQRLRQAMAPTKHFERFCADESGNLGHVETPLREYSLAERMESERPVSHPCWGEKGLRLDDAMILTAPEKAALSDPDTTAFSGMTDPVFDEKLLQDFLNQLSDEELCILLRGEGMSSPKVTAGTAGAFGGVCDALQQRGIPLACCSDGPSGIRMECGTIAFSVPNGTCLASSFNEALSEELFAMVGLELLKNRIDTLLGPGMNIHRSPLNGRNFEYFSEDPFLTGKMATAQLKGLHRYGVTGTIKHFACNNQEFHRHDVNAVVSERALREIYLKGFEMAVREGGAFSIMSSYNLINGIHAASNYDLLTTILRGEWDYTGIVMTDWWARGNEEGCESDRRNFASMVRAQNDLYMVTRDAAANTNEDNLEEALKCGKLTRGELMRCAANLCRVLMRLPAMARQEGRPLPVEEALDKEGPLESKTAVRVAEISVSGEINLPVDMLKNRESDDFLDALTFKHAGNYPIQMTARSRAVSDLAQLPVFIFIDNILKGSITLSGADREWRKVCIELGEMPLKEISLRLHFGENSLEVGGLKVIVKNNAGL